MELHRTILEMQGPIAYELILQEIIKNNKVTNPYQLHVLVLLSQFFKDGTKDIRLLGSLMTYGTDATSIAVIDPIKALSPQDKVNLAQYLLDCIKDGESKNNHSHEISVQDWIQLVLRKNGS